MDEAKRANMARGPPLGGQLTRINDRPPEEAFEIRARGGRNVTAKRMLGAKEAGSRKAKCKNCPLICEFKNANLDRNKECTCVVSSLRAKALINQNKSIDVSEDFIKGATFEVMEKIMELYRDNPEAFSGKTMYWLIEIKKNFYPEINKNLNIQVGFKEYYDEFKKSREEQFKKEEVIIDVEKDEQEQDEQEQDSDS